MKFDWVGLLRAGVSLGLRPSDVWALTPAELALMLGKDGGSAGPLSRARLEELAAAFPDGGLNDGSDRSV